MGRLLKIALDQTVFSALMNLLYRLIRTSKGLEIAGRSPALVASLVRRAHAVTGIGARGMEAPFISRYDAGDAFRAHFDLFDVDNSAPFPEPATHNGRSKTLLVFLAETAAGGETEFMVADGGRPLRVRPRVGAALLWSNCRLAQAHPSLVPDCVARDPASLHQGRPPAAGATKHTLTVWLRQRPINPERMATLCDLTTSAAEGPCQHDATLRELCSRRPSRGPNRQAAAPNRQ